TGLADAGLSAKKYDLTFAALDPIPEGRHLLQFMLPPDKMCKLARLASEESALDRSFPRDPISSDRVGNSHKFAQLRIIADEHVTEEFACARGDDDRLWGCDVP